MRAINLAWEQNVDAVEIDVRLTRDGKLVLSHDEDAWRVANSPLVIAESSYADLLALDFGAGERIAMIESALRSIPLRKRMYIEIKCGVAAIVPLRRAIGETATRAEQVVVISFEKEAVAECKRELPDVRAYWLVEFGREGEPTIEQVIATANDLRADGVDVSHRRPLDADAVTQFNAAGLGVCVWTVDEIADAQRVIGAGVDGITSNCAAWLRRSIFGRDRTDSSSR
jgi:glycerophosphoryl diester phosphodiesterase